jgi:hypothetical protein
VNTQHGCPDEFYKVALTLVVDQSVGVDTEALHHTVRSRDTSVRHGPHEHVGSLGVQVLEVPEVVVGGLGLRDLIVRLGLARVNDIGKLEGVLDEEDGNVVSNNVPVTSVDKSAGWNVWLLLAMLTLQCRT